jgi:hypothetical protein
MRIDLTEDRLTLTFEGAERFWAFKASPVSVPRDRVTGVQNRLPPSTWKTLRAPGTMVPGLIKAGTYYTPAGKELWYATRAHKGDPLAIELAGGEPYRWIALTIEDSVAWAERIRAWMVG